MFISHDKLMKILGIKQTTDHETNQLFVLCQKCYNIIYAIICGPCSCCRATPSKAFCQHMHSLYKEEMSQHLSDRSTHQL